MIEYILIGIVVLLVAALVWPQRTVNPLCQKNPQHIEWGPGGMPILKKRINFDRCEIKSPENIPGYLQYAGMSKVRLGKEM